MYAPSLPGPAPCVRGPRARRVSAFGPTATAARSTSIGGDRQNRSVCGPRTVTARSAPSGRSATSGTTASRKGSGATAPLSSDKPTSGQTPTRRCESSSGPVLASTARRGSPLIRGFAQPPTSRRRHPGDGVVACCFKTRPGLRLQKGGDATAQPPAVSVGTRDARRSGVNQLLGVAAGAPARDSGAGQGFTAAELARGRGITRQGWGSHQGQDDLDESPRDFCRRRLAWPGGLSRI